MTRDDNQGRLKPMFIQFVLEQIWAVYHGINISVCAGERVCVCVLYICMYMYMMHTNTHTHTQTHTHNTHTQHTHTHTSVLLQPETEHAEPFKKNKKNTPQKTQPSSCNQTRSGR